MSMLNTAESRHLSRLPYFPANKIYAEKHQFEPAYRVSVYADMVDVQTLNPPKRETTLSTKNKVHGFSDKSRHNMIEFLAKVVEVPDLFVTLTYSDDIAEHAVFNMRHDFEVFRKWLERKYPQIKAMWRVEFQDRKSGKHQGRLIPHMHLLVWLPASMIEFEKHEILAEEGQVWRNKWHNITHSQDEYHLARYGCLVERIKSRRHAYAYCSKYLAKADYEKLEAGRRWGRIGQFEQPTELETELTARAYIHFKRLLNAFIKSKSPKFYKHFKNMSIKTGCSVFGLGFISQEHPIGKRTIYKMIRHARELALQEQETSKVTKTTF